jgi:ATP phosphoribosyltransferase
MNSVQATSARTRREGLRSAATTNYVTPRLRTKFGERSFSYAGPADWNALPADLREQTVSTTFKKQLKTYFFKSAFNIN